MLGMVRYILYNVLTVLLYYIQMGQCNEKLLTRRKLVTGESFKVCVRLGHLEKGASRSGRPLGETHNMPQTTGRHLLGYSLDIRGKRGSLLGL